MKRGTELFRESIRPVFAETCLRCHGGEKLRADFDISSRQTFLKGGESGMVVDLSAPAESLILKLLRHAEEPTMPPKKPMLEEALVQQIETWIGLGAPYDKPLIEGLPNGAKREMQVTETDRAFWSFKPLADPVPPSPLPDSAPEEWTSNPIDAFVFAKLAEKKLTPNSPADPALRVRRSYLDLIGLPPTPEQLAAGLKMSQAELVDTLLESPHYGERWARHWLDAARFGESHGFEQDYDRKHAYHYRDFVIKALNADMPWTQFVQWQLAGDEIAPDEPLAMMATGFLGAGVFPTQLTEKEFESARYDELDDMAATTGTAMLGLTIGCARCHDHKFDPIPVKDYYRFVSTFTTTIRSEIDIDLYEEQHAETLAAWKTEHAKVEKARATHENDAKLLANFETWLASPKADAMSKADWNHLALENRSSTGGASFTPQADGSLLVGGKSAKGDRHTFSADTHVQGIRHLRIEALTHPSMKRNGPGRASNGNIGLSNLKVMARPLSDPNAKPVNLTFAAAAATHQQNEGNLSVASAIDKDPKKTGWAVDVGGIGKDQAAVFALAEPIGFPGGTRLEFELNYDLNNQHVIGRPRLSVSGSASPPVEVGNGVSEDFVNAVTARKAGKMLPKHRATFLRIFLQEDAAWQKLDAVVAASMGRRPSGEKVKVQVSSEGFKPTKHNADSRGFPHFYPVTHHLDRGDANQKKGIAEPGFLQVLMKPGTTVEDWNVEPPEGWRTSYRRRALANWMVDTENGAGHLLARVAVNRLWHHHFGRGLVSTPNDFGLQGTEPSHPELLDFLARRLIAHGWRLKPLHREILGSAAWMQSSEMQAEDAVADPENALLWRFAPRRLEAEIVRDAMLAVSGQLDPKPFGPGTLDPRQKRRSIYFMIKRSKLVPMMQIFDQPEPLASQGNRPSTTIAPQALHFMNNEQVLQQALALAGSLLKEPSDKAAVSDLFIRVIGREPGPDEARDALSFFEAQTASYPAGKGRRQALADLAQVLFSLNEFIFIQ